jgi:peptidoglycan LD-endopeptidase LytH
MLAAAGVTGAVLSVAGAVSRPPDPSAGGSPAPPGVSLPAPPPPVATPGAPDDLQPSLRLEQGAGRAGSSRAAALSYDFPVAGCSVTYAQGHHDYPAADIFAERGCRVVAPVAGRVDEVSRTDRWTPAGNRGPDRGGRSVSLVGVDGVRYYASHLETVTAGIRPGMAVAPGQALGTVGDSGSARGTASHLHFGISWPTTTGRWWVRRGMVAPQPFLDAWRAGHDRSPAGAVEDARRRLGQESRCTSYC